MKFSEISEVVPGYMKFAQRHPKLHHAGPEQFSGTVWTLSGVQPSLTAPRHGRRYEGFQAGGGGGGDGGGAPPPLTRELTFIKVY